MNKNKLILALFVLCGNNLNADSSISKPEFQTTITFEKPKKGEWDYNQVMNFYNSQPSSPCLAHFTLWQLKQIATHPEVSSEVCTQATVQTKELIKVAKNKTYPECKKEILDYNMAFYTSIRHLLTPEQQAASDVGALRNK